MGADGGTIPRRDELVKEKKKPEKKDKISEMKHRWNDCSLSQLPLTKPVMACEYGNLYNKESLLEFLLDKQKYENCANFSHIRGLKDVRELSLQDNPALQRTDDKMDITDAASYICPVTGLEMNGRHRFCFLWTCGCVLSERAIKEVPSHNCHKCTKPFTQNDIIVLNGDDEDFKLMKANMEERRAKAKLAKRSKKSASSTCTAEEPKAKVSKQAESATASADKSKRKDKPKSASAAAVRSSSHTAASAIAAGLAGSVQDDPNASSVYKSLFTSSDEAKKQGKQHSGWVSFNPQYFR